MNKFANGKLKHYRSTEDIKESEKIFIENLISKQREMADHNQVTLDIHQNGQK